MRDGQILGIIKQVIPLGGIMLASVGGLFCIGYGGIYKKILKGKRCITMKQVIHIAILIFYITGIYGVAFMERISGLDGGVMLKPFYSYRVAWNSYAENPWRDIILNIIMFIPWGILIPLCFPKCRKAGIVFILGILGTLTVEIGQYITQRGIFEFDDIINNTIGTMIGYGIFILTWWAYGYIKKDRVKVRITWVMCAQIPFITAVLFFSYVMWQDCQHKFGTLDIAYDYCIDMDGVCVSTDIHLSSQYKEVDVYEEDKNADGGRKLKSIRKCFIRTEQDVYNMIKRGRFYDYGYDNLKSIRVTGYKLDWKKDSRGYYQPVYEMDVVINETKESVIEIPALL